MPLQRTVSAADSLDPPDRVAGDRGLATEDLDAILALQLTIAWAGEGQSEPPRLGWWRSDLVDVEGGAGLLRELLPNTWRWAALQAVRKAAILVDRRAREQMAESGRVRTLFSWGFDIDEKLDDRLLAHKQSRAEPTAVLALPLDFDAGFARERFATWLAGLGTVETRLAPDGRELLHVPAALLERARALAAALLPLSPTWPTPFFRVETPI